MKIKRVWDLKKERFDWKVTVDRPYRRASYFDVKLYKAILQAMKFYLVRR